MPLRRVVAMGLRNRIMLLVAIGLVAATAPLGIMGLGMVRAATDRVLEERLAMTRATADHLNERLAQGWWQLSQLSTRAALLWNSGNLGAIRQDFVTLSPQMPLFSGGLFLVDRSGNLLVQEPASPALRLTSLAHDPTLDAVFLARHQQTSGIERTAGGVPVVFFAVPVFASPDTVVGAVGGVIDLARPTLLTFINGLAQGVSGHAAIVASDGMVLASTDTGELFSRNEHPEFFARFIAQGRPLVGPGEENHGSGARGEVHIMAFAPITSVPWGLGIGQNEQETFGPIRRLRDRIILFEVLVLIAALVFAWLDTSAVAAPLRLLQGAAERIAGGDLDRQIEVRRGDEIGMLARSFETMRVQLRRSLEENARLQERLQSVAMLEERERIAREMHDSVGQVLGYVNTKAQAVKVLIDAGKIKEAQTQLVQLEEAARDVYADLREAILNLRTATSPEQRLIPALQEYVKRFTELSGVDTQLAAGNDPARYSFSPTTELHIFRIIQEALTNVRKHSMARRAWVQFGERDGAPVVTVTDDGIGFDSSRVESGTWPGFGLQTMRERAEEIGGTFAIRRRDGVGTEVEVSLPAQEGRGSNARAAGG